MRLDRRTGTFAFVNASDRYQEQARKAAQRAQELLAQPATLDPYDWGLAATLVIEADEALKLAREHDQAISLPLLDIVLEELRDASSDFTAPDFIRATRPQRRQKPRLFTSKR